MKILDRLKRKKRKKAVVVGLDGVPSTLLQKLRGEGAIPHMASIFDSGYFGRMEVSIPEISSVSWSSFMTGEQPGRHGVYGFMDFEPGSYKMYFPNYSHLKAPALWDDLAKENKRSVVINMPSTYPARKIDGVLVSGFVAVDFNRAVYPETLIPRLLQMEYRVDIDTRKARKDHEYLFNDLRETLKSREKAVEYCWDEIDWDLFAVVITGTDRLMHFLWDAGQDPDHKHHGDFIDYFNQVDAFVGRVYDRFQCLEGSKDGQNRFFMLSDHGFTGIRTEVYLNRWLEENHYLKFDTRSPQTIMDLGSQTTAFAMDPSRIYIHSKGKYPSGRVSAGEYDKIRTELKGSLEELTFENGVKVIQKAFFKEELYSGPYVDHAPDIVLLSNRGFDLKGRLNGKVFDVTDLKGMHTQDDAFFFNSKGIEKHSIFSVKNAILEAIL